MRRPRPTGGFTLLEVMVALAVLAGSLMAVASLSGSALRNYGYAREMSVATLLAQGKMAELEEKYDDSGFTDFDQKDDGNFSDQGQPGMRWSLAIRKPTAEITAERILSVFLGGGSDGGGQELLGKLLGTGGGA
ncbi:MAG: prepilin-type N-terminal cleavage/methylation domain-containing protein, partial [Deltaproteobacteria bacterium]